MTATLRRLVVVLTLLRPLAGWAQSAPNPFGESWIRFSGAAAGVTNGYGDWASLGFRAAVIAGPRDLVLGEARWQRAFGDRGVYAGGGLRHAFGPKWFTTTTVGGGTGRFALPDLRFDASVHRKLAPRDRVLLTAGFTTTRSKDVYHDRSAFGSLAVYGNGVVAEGGVRINWSNPGNSRSTRGFGALTVGRAGERYVVVRGSAGREGYQLLGTAPTLREFASQEVAVEYEEWLGRRTSLILGVDYYHNPFYRRTGGSLGVARHW